MGSFNFQEEMNFRTEEQTLVMILQARLAFTTSVLWISSMPAEINIIMSISVQRNSYEGNTMHFKQTDRLHTCLSDQLKP
jgi:hypothetical protein